MQINNTNNLISQLGRSTSLPDQSHNYCVFNDGLVKELVSKREDAIPYLSTFLSSTTDEKQISEALYVLDRMIDSGVKGIDKLYPLISRFNDTNSPNIQVLLAGIYRKTQVPDAFGPLTKMMLRQTFYPNSPYFDPTEEIGGAILEYLKTKEAPSAYSKEKTPSLLQYVLNA